MFTNNESSVSTQYQKLILTVFICYWYKLCSALKQMLRNVIYSTIWRYMASFVTLKKAVIPKLRSSIITSYSAINYISQHLYLFAPWQRFRLTFWHLCDNFMMACLIRPIRISQVWDEVVVATYGREHVAMPTTGKSTILFRSGQENSKFIVKARECCTCQQEPMPEKF